MNERTAYEITISGKLSQLPVPDMADAIWARITTQLDIDMPPGEGGDDPAPASPRGGKGVGLGIGAIIFLAALLTYFNTSHTPEAATVSPASQKPANNSSENISIQPGTNMRNDAPTISVGSKQLPGNQGIPYGDSVVVLPLTLTAGTDSMVQPTIVHAEPLQKDSVISPAPQKTRGVKGIGDKDYRIVPKRDSN